MDIFNKPYELENQLILRFPQEEADKLNEIILAGNLKDRLKIEMNTDGKNGTVILDGEKLAVKLLDLPCIIESLKTLDMKTFYKTADIAQILMCSKEDSELQSKLITMKDKKYPHGVTPPLKNVKKRRFRKTARKKYIDSPDIEKEVKRLLKADMEAVSVHYEIVTEEDKTAEKVKTNPQSKNIDITDQDELHKIFQDLSSSESENEKDDVNVEDLDGVKDIDVRDIPKGVPVVTDKRECERLEVRLEQLSSELAELKKRKQRKEHLIKGENIKNEMLKRRFQGELEELTIRISETKQDYLHTLAQLGRTK